MKKLIVILALVLMSCSWSPPLMLPGDFPVWRGVSTLEEEKNRFLVNIYDLDRDEVFDVIVWTLIIPIDDNKIGMFFHPYRVERWWSETLMVERWTDHDVDGQPDLYEVLQDGRWKTFHFDGDDWVEVVVRD